MSVQLYTEAAAAKDQAQAYKQLAIQREKELRAYKEKVTSHLQEVSNCVQRGTHPSYEVGSKQDMGKIVCLLGGPANNLADGSGDLCVRCTLIDELVASTAATYHSSSCLQAAATLAENACMLRTAEQKKEGLEKELRAAKEKVVSVKVQQLSCRSGILLPLGLHRVPLPNLFYPASHW